MIRPTSTLAVIGLAIAAASCRTSPSDERREEWMNGALVHYTLKEDHVIVSAHKGPIGYIKIYDVTEGGGPAYEWKYVYDSNWNELGFVDQFGTATKYHYYSPSEQAQQNRVLRAMKLPSDSLQANVLRMMDIDPSSDELTFPVARREDITGPAAVPLAGPGIVPAKGPVSK
jgi:hypothetical protein